jgi:hypothetical protein
MGMTKQPKKIQVVETQRYWSDFEGSLASIIFSLQSDLDDGWEGITTESIGCDGAVEYYLYKHRLETDKEYEKRMKEMEKQKDKELKAKEKRRKEYEKLKKEFGND